MLDKRSRNLTYTISTRLYDKANALALADLIKAHSGGQAATLDIPLDGYDSSVSVFPAAGTQQALSLEYAAGTKFVEVQLSLTRVGSVRGTSSALRADTPRKDGSGPIALAGDGISVEFPRDITVERALGRPHVDVSGRSDQDYPTVTDERKSSYDAFTLSLTSISDAAAKTASLRDMFLQKRGRDSLTLDFGGVHGMGRFNVVPDPGAQALRMVDISGRKHSEDMQVPQIQLRVVR